MKGWKYESHRHMLAAKGVKTVKYMALRGGAVVPQRGAPSEYEVTRENEFKGFVTRKRTPMEEYLFDLEKNPSRGMQRVLKLRQVYAEATPEEKSKMDEKFNQIRLNLYEGQRRAAAGDTVGAKQAKEVVNALLHPENKSDPDFLKMTVPDEESMGALQSTLVHAEDSQLKKKELQNASLPVQVRVEVKKGNMTKEEAEKQIETAATNVVNQETINTAQNIYDTRLQREKLKEDVDSLKDAIKKWKEEDKDE
jgi:hypothetical protein